MTHRPQHLRSDRRRRLSLGLLAVLVLIGIGVAAAIEVARSDGDGTETATDDTLAGEGPSSSTSTTATTLARRAGEPITIAFAGDSYFEGALRSRLDSSPDTALGPFADQLRAADLTVINLETAIAVGGTRADKQFAFRAPPAALGALRAAGVDVASMANNHGLDYGPDGLQESLAAKAAQADGMVIGIGTDEDDAYRPYRATVKGQRVAVIAATQVMDDSLITAWTATASKAGMASAKRVDRLVAEVGAARANSDTVVVFLHWGVEKETCPTASQEDLAETLVAAGADIVVGSHAHRLQGGGRLGDAVVHYGLGNFLFKENSAEGARTGVFEVTIDGREVQGYRWTPGRISGSVPRPLTGTDASNELRYWEGLRSCTNLSA